MSRAADMIKSAENIVVFTGAGISTGCGIIDFRGPNGLYRITEEKYHLPYPEAIFDLNYFLADPVPFFDLTKNIFMQDVSPTRCHRLVADLEARGKLSLLVTQNIDMLHQKAGSEKILECHGSYESAHCLSCRRAYTKSEIEEDIMTDRIPRCSCGGIIKPDVVFFGENLPEEFYRIMETPPVCDLILILGTSLNVQPASRFAVDMAARAPSLLVNREKTPYDGRMKVVLHEDLEVFAEEMTLSFKAG